MSQEFLRIVDANIRLTVSSMLLQQMQPGYAFIKDEYDTALLYYDASLKYEIAGNYKNVANALIAGGVAICTFAVGTWIVAALTTETLAVGSGVAMGAGGIPAYVAPTITVVAPSVGTKLGISALVGVSGILTSGFIKGSLGLGSGYFKAADAGKLAFVVAGGAAKCGPIFGVLYGEVGGASERYLREKMLAELSSNEVKKYAKKTLKEQTSLIGGKIRGSSKEGLLAFLPLETLNKEMRMPALKESKRLTNDFMKNDKSVFSSPNRNHVNSAIRAKVGTQLWAPVLSEANKLQILLEMESARAQVDLKKAYKAWSGKVSPVTKTKK